MTNVELMVTGVNNARDFRRQIFRQTHGDIEEGKMVQQHLLFVIVRTIFCAFFWRLLFDGLSYFLKSRPRCVRAQLPLLDVVNTGEAKIGGNHAAAVVDVNVRVDLPRFVLCNHANTHDVAFLHFRHRS